MVWTDMTYSYHKVLRLPISTFKTRGKDYLTFAEAQQLLEGEFIVQEKLDGKASAIRVDEYVFHFEDLKIQHTVPYDKLPAFRIVFDVWDITTRTLFSYDEMMQALIRNGYEKFTPPLLATYLDGPYHPDDIAEKFLGTQSKFSTLSTIEGIVIKNYKKQMMGKIVDPKFEEAVDGGVHPMKRKEQVYNRLA